MNSVYLLIEKNVEKNVLWPGNPLYFAKTSGTTSGIKYIPITNVSIKTHINSARDSILNYIHNRDKKPDWILWIDCDEISKIETIVRNEIPNTENDVFSGLSKDIIKINENNCENLLSIKKEFNIVFNKLDHCETYMYGILFIFYDQVMEYL